MTLSYYAAESGLSLVKQGRFYAEIIHDPLRRMAAFGHRRHHQIGAADGISAGKNFVVRGLIAVAALDTGLNPPPVIKLYADGLQPRHPVGMETKGHNHRIGRHHELAARQRRRAAAPLLIRITQLCAQKTYAVNPAGAIQFQRHRLNVKYERRPFFTSVRI